jgi:hypothetical protein
MSFDNPLVPYTTSGEFGFTMTVEELISEGYAVLKMGVDGEAITGDMYNRALITLNLLLQSFQADGLTLSIQNNGSLFLVGGQTSYPVSSSNIINDYTETALSVAAVATDTTVTVDDDADITDGDTIGILLDSGEIQWTTVNGTPAANVVTLTDALTGAAGIDNNVFNYSGTLNKISRLMDVNRLDDFSTENPMEICSRQDYFVLADKTAEGVPSQVYFNRQTQTFYLYPTPQDGQNVLKFNYEQVFDAAVNPSDVLLFPAYYYEAIVYGLSKRLGLKYRVPPDVMQLAITMAEETHNKALAYDDEQGNIHITLGHG